MKCLLVRLVSLLAAAVCITSAGCETEPTEETGGAITISSSTGSFSVEAGGALVLTASGGASSYSWTVESTTYGNLSASSGSQVTYTAASDAGANTVTCTSGGELASVVVTTVQ